MPEDVLRELPTALLAVKAARERLQTLGFSDALVSAHLDVAEADAEGQLDRSHLSPEVRSSRWRGLRRLRRVPETNMITKGRNRDTDWFSITDAEWPVVKAAHERWLDPANFDTDGRQRTPLRVDPS